jgi:hypothetical protein
VQTVAGRCSLRSRCALRRMGVSSPFRHVRLPGDVDTVFNGLVSGTLLRVKGHSSFRLIPCPGGNFESIPDPDCGDLEYALSVFNISLNISHKVVGRWNPPRIQRGAQGPGQSSCNACDDVVKGGRVFRAFNFPAVLLLVKSLDASMDSKVNGILEILYIGSSMGSLMFVNANVTGVS